MATIDGMCPKCRTTTLEFDFGGIVSGPGIKAYPEVGELMHQDCECELTDADIEYARVAIVESPELYIG